jgi:hypothetical protein
MDFNPNLVFRTRPDVAHHLNCVIRALQQEIEIVYPTLTEVQINFGIMISLLKLFFTVLKHDCRE